MDDIIINFHQPAKHIGSLEHVQQEASFLLEAISCRRSLN